MALIVSMGNDLVSLLLWQNHPATLPSLLSNIWIEHVSRYGSPSTALHPDGFKRKSKFTNVACGARRMVVSSLIDLFRGYNAVLCDSIQNKSGAFIADGLD
jgi:hypothetical protein